MERWMNGCEYSLMVKIHRYSLEISKHGLVVPVFATA